MHRTRQKSSLLATSICFCLECHPLARSLSHERKRAPEETSTVDSSRTTMSLFYSKAETPYSKLHHNPNHLLTTSSSPPLPAPVSPPPMISPT